MALGRFSRRELWSRPFRVFLTFSSIAIGVAAVVSILLATSTTRTAQTEMLRAVTGDADLEMLSDGAQGVPYTMVQVARDVPGVEIAAPSITRLAVLFVGERKARTQVLGIDPRIDGDVRSYKLVAGEFAKRFDELVLDRSFAESLGTEVGDTVKLLARGGLKEYRLTGLVAPTGAGAVALSNAGYLALPAAQSAFKTGNLIDQVLIKVSDDADVEQVQAELLAELPNGLTIRKPRTSNDMARETMYSTENGLLMAVAFALLISIFIIYNTFQMAVGERRRQLGILRAVGATRRQVGWMILREALAISVVASIGGCLLGVWLASYLNAATERMLQVELPSVNLTWLPFVIAVLVGIGVSVLGALLPALRASSVQPMEAMRAVEIQHNDEVVRLTKPLGFLLIPLGGALLAAATLQWLPFIGGDVAGIVLILLGIVLLLPSMLTPLSSFGLRLLSPWLGIESELAQKELLRHIGRSTLTIGVLFVAISTSTGMAGNIMDNVDNVRAWYSRAIIGDFFVRASMPDLSAGTAADIPDHVGDDLRKIEGVETCDGMRFVSAQSGETSILLVVRSFLGEEDQFFDLVQGTSAETMAGLQNGKIVIGSVLAQRMELGIGDQLPIETPQGTSPMQIVAVANDYVGGGLTVYMDRGVATDLLGVEGVDAFVIRAVDGQEEAVEKRLRAYCLEHSLILQSYAELVGFIDSMMNGVVASLWMLLLIGCSIAAMGLVNTLTMNVLEQTREIGMLRVVAMTRRQVRKMIFAQATLMGMLGLLPGAVAGIFVAYSISLSSNAVLGHEIVFQFRPWLVVGALVFGVVIVMLASLIPAERAARLKLGAALHYE